MRKRFKLSVLVVILFVLANGVTGCKDDAQEYGSVEKCDCGQQYIKKVEGVGTVSFNNTVGKWQITVAVEGSYDSASMYLVSGEKKLDDYANQKVSFSGKAYSLSNEEDLTLPAGTDCYCITLSTIELSK